MREVILFAVTFLLISGVVWLIVWNGKREQRKTEGVKGSDIAAPAIMSRADNAPPQNVPSPLETDGRRTADRPMIATPTQEKILDIFRAMRAAGMRRDAISGAWRAAGLPFDNNLWTKAAPPEEEEAPHITPIAGRPTKAGYYPDRPDLDYQPPPN